MGLAADFYLAGTYPTSFPELAATAGPDARWLLRKVTGSALFSSDDDGRTWQELRPNVISFHLDPSSGKLVLVQWLEGTGREVVSSTDGGLTMEPVVSYDDFLLLAAHLVADRSALLVGRTDGLYRTELDAPEPQLVLSPSGEGWGAVRMRSSPAVRGTVYLTVGDALDPTSVEHRGEPFDVMSRTLWRSTDDGRSWTQIDITAPRDVIIDGDGTVAALTDDGISVLE